ncbi:hypothetical protein C5167_022066, partial [Papaver somniferum]
AIIRCSFFNYNINWNYGLLPQTCEDPTVANSEVDGAFGNNDPVDVVEIGDRQGKIGEILKVKPLGALAMINEGELDWKIVATSLDDPRASLVNDVGDVEKHFPIIFLLILFKWSLLRMLEYFCLLTHLIWYNFQGTLTAIRDWFRDYKIPDGKPANKFGLGNKAANKDYALKVITETNEAWAKLVKRTVPAGDFYPLFQTFFLAEFETNFLQFFVSNILYSFFLSSFFSVLVFFNGF